MQETIFYVAAGETLGAVRDFANAKSAAPPTLVRGVSALLRMRLSAHRDGLEPYPLEALDGIVRWQWRWTRTSTRPPPTCSRPTLRTSGSPR